jgi:hypothetical protein
VESGSDRSVSLKATPREGVIEVAAVDEQGNDLEAEVFVDGVLLGPAPGQYRVIVGQHEVIVRYSGMQWLNSVEVLERRIAPVRADFMLGVRKPAPEPIVESRIRSGTPEGVFEHQGLWWWVQDNGSEINANEAARYAQEQMALGFTDWRLPTIEELQALYRPDLSKGIPSDIRLGKCSVWSSERKSNGVCRAFNFCSGRILENDRSYRSIHRALIVRPAR